MGRAIVLMAGIVLIVLVVGFFVIRGLKEANKVGDLTVKQEREMRALLHDAAQVFYGLGPSYDLSETGDFLSERSQGAIDAWLKQFNAHLNREKEISA